MMQFWKSKLFWISTVFIFVIAIFVRFVNLNSLPVFADEAIYVRWAQIMRAEASLRFLPLSDGKQPLYMWAISPALKVISDPLLAGRLFSGLVGLGTVLGVSTTAFLLFKNHRIAIISGLLWAVLPYPVFFERMALVDGTLVFFSIWFFNLLYLSQAHLRLDMALLAGFAGGFAWLTKSPAMFILAMAMTLIIYIPKYTKKNLALSLFLYLVSLTVAFAMYNILRLGPQFHMIALRNADYVYSFAESLQTPLDPLIPHLKDVFWFFFYLLTPFGLVLLPFGIFDGHRSHLKPRFTLSLFLLAPIFVESVIAKGFTARYLLSTIPFAVILMAHGLEHLGQKTNRHILTVAMTGLVVVTALWFDLRFILNPNDALLPANEKTGYLEEWTAGTGLKEVSQYLRNAAKNGPVMVGSEGFFGTPFDALGMYLNDVKNVRIIGVGVSIDSVDQKLKNSLVDNQVFLVVNSFRFNADPDNPPAGLKLIASYPKAIRADGTRESLLFFQVFKP